MLDKKMKRIVALFIGLMLCLLPGCSSSSTESHMTVFLFNQTEINLDQITVEYYLGDEPMGGVSGMNANDSPIAVNESLDFQFLSSDFSKKDCSDFSFLCMIYPEGENTGIPCHTRVSIQLSPDGTYECAIVGSEEDGFSIVSDDPAVSLSTVENPEELISDPFAQFRDLLSDTDM